MAEAIRSIDGGQGLANVGGHDRAARHREELAASQLQLGQPAVVDAVNAWERLELRMLEYEPSILERLVLDAVEPLEENRRGAVDYVTARR